MNEIYTPKKYKAYIWTLVKSEDTKEVLTKESKASSEIKHLLNDGYRITRRKPVCEDIYDKTQEAAKSNDPEHNSLRDVSKAELDVWFEEV